MNRLNKPIALATWKHGYKGILQAQKILNNSGSALDAIEFGINVTENDPQVRTVGYGGFTDQDGKVTLDACIMDETVNCGSVSFLQHIKHPMCIITSTCTL